MAGRVKFPLKMPDGTQARTIEDLREHFDYNSVLEYYQNGKLKTWLEDRDYTKEAQMIGYLRPSADGLMKEICEILGMEYSESKAPIVSMNSVAMKNNNYERLKQYTADDEILKNVDKVAFSQEDLLELLDNGAKEIYLCGDEFVIPGDIANIKYIGVNKTHVRFAGDVISEGIEIENAICDLSHYEGNYADFKETFQNNPKLGFGLLNKYLECLKVRDINASNDNYVELIKILSRCYYYGFGIEQNDDKFVEYCLIAAEHNDAKAQYKLGQFYEDKGNIKKAFEWYNRAVQQDCVDASKLNQLASIYYYGEGIDKDLAMAFQYWSRAVQKGDVHAMRVTGECYIDGEGVEQNEEKGIQLLQSAYEQGNKEAISYLLRYKPDIVDSSDALIFAIGGRENLYRDGGIIWEDGNVHHIPTLRISVNDRSKINSDALNLFASIHNAFIHNEDKNFDNNHRPYVFGLRFFEMRNEDIKSLIKNFSEKEFHIVYVEHN
jgi:tetratricopeptide (TPR) repeat protein